MATYQWLDSIRNDPDPNQQKQGNAWLLAQIDRAQDPDGMGSAVFLPENIDKLAMMYLGRPIKNGADFEQIMSGVNRALAGQPKGAKDPSGLFAVPDPGRGEKWAGPLIKAGAAAVFGGALAGGVGGAAGAETGGAVGAEAGAAGGAAGGAYGVVPESYWSTTAGLSAASDAPALGAGTVAGGAAAAPAAGIVGAGGAAEFGLGGGATGYGVGGNAAIPAAAGGSTTAAAVPWYATPAAGAAATLGSGLLGAGASLYAGNVQANAADRASAAQQAQFAQTRADLEPWRQAGLRSLDTLEQRMPELTRRFSLADFLKDPGYEFRLSEGEKAINRAAAARGSWDSGGTGKALTRYGQDYASGEFGNAYNRFTTDQGNEFNRRAALSGVGQTATQNIAEFGAGATNRAQDALLTGAAARGAGAVGATNALGSGAVNSFNLMNQYRLIDALTNRPQVYPNYAVG